MCCLMRPFDDDPSHRVMAEAEAVLEVLERVRDGSLSLIASAAHRTESAWNSHEPRRAFLRNVLGMAAEFTPFSIGVRRRAEAWQAKGVRVLDSWHLACAEESRVDVFSTCDDNLLKKGRRWSVGMRCLSLLELAREIRS
jgi:hypothetical protein